MILKYFRHNKKTSNNKKDANSAIGYVLGNKDHEGATRKVVPEVLKGDPEQVRQLIAQGRQAGKYTSGALTFTERDISPSRLQAVIDLHEKSSFPGMDSSRYSALWVLHRDKDKTELHFIYPNEDLLTGKKLNAYVSHYYARGKKIDIDGKRMDAWKNMVNAKFGFSDPNDPARRRGIELYERKRWPKDKQELIGKINDYITHQVASGVITNRADVVSELKELGFSVTRQTASRISIANPDKRGGQNIALKGAFFEKGFKADTSYADKLKAESAAYRANAGQRFEDNKVIFNELYKKKKEWNLNRYSTKEKKFKPKSRYNPLTTKMSWLNFEEETDIVDYFKVGAYIRQNKPTMQHMKEDKTKKQQQEEIKNAELKRRNDEFYEQSLGRYRKAKQGFKQPFFDLDTEFKRNAQQSADSTVSLKQLDGQLSSDARKLRNDHARLGREGQTNRDYAISNATIDGNISKIIKKQSKNKNFGLDNSI